MLDKRWYVFFNYIALLTFITEFFAKTAPYLAKYGTGSYQVRARNYLVSHSLSLIEPLLVNDVYKYVPIANWKHSPTKSNRMEFYLHFIFFYNFFFYSDIDCTCVPQY